VHHFNPSFSCGAGSCILVLMIQKQEPWRRTLLRTEEMAQKYEEAQKENQEPEGCRLCNDTESIAEYEYWRLMPNMFPYDRYFTKSDMLVTKRHIDEHGLTQEEREEFLKLKNEVFADQYDSVLDNLPRQRSIPDHCHFHLIQFKRLD